MSKIAKADVIGSGPNGFAAAIRLQENGYPTTIYEAKNSIGGGMRSAEITLPGFMHDICSAIHPLAIGSPFFKTLPLRKYGLEWIQPEVPLAHPFDEEPPALLERSIEATGCSLGEDAKAYKNLMESFVTNWPLLENAVLGALHFPSHPILLAKLAFKALRSCSSLTRQTFQGKRARALFAGLSAHSMMPLNWSLTAGFGLILAILGHAVGWPLPRGGSQKIADALTEHFKTLGGKIVTDFEVQDLKQLPEALHFFDVTPKQLLNIVKDNFPNRYIERLKKYRYGPGIFKMDWALDRPIPWKSPECLKAGTIHLGGTLEEIELSESLVWENKIPEKPFVLLAQPSLFDKTRAPENKHTAWAYCHVPSGTTVDMSERIESQIERFAPGFRDCILAKSVKGPKDLEKYNSNYVNGDINGGVQDLSQFVTRPIASLHPYFTPLKNVVICSSSTPPGGGVHGMCGYNAVNSFLKSIDKL